MRSSRIVSILRSSSELIDPVRVSGAPSAARALLVARYAEFYREQGRGPVVVFLANDDLARDFCDDLECMTATLETPPLSVMHLPTWEQSPYSAVTLSLKTRLSRLKVLGALAQKNFPDVIVSTAAGCCQATLPQEVFHRFSLKIQIDHSLESREAFARRLTESGYSRIDPVEDPGTYAVRGDIVDVFPPNLQRPVRIELFGDLVERIRSFDPATQRTVEEEKTKEKNQSILIIPAREVLINTETTQLLRERVKYHADDVGISRSTRDPILQTLQNGGYPDHCDAWGPFAYPHASSLWEYLPEATPVIWNDELQCREEWNRFLEDQHRLAKEGASSEVIAPPVEALFLPIQKKGRLFLDRISLNASEALSDQGTSQELSAHHEVQVQNHLELGLGAHHSLEEITPRFYDWMKLGYKTFIFAPTQSQMERIRFLLEKRQIPCHTHDQPLAGTINLRLGSLTSGFQWPAEGMIVLTESEVLGSKHSRSQERPKTESGSASKEWSGLQALSDLSIGDSIVHIEHGIGRYQGLTRLSLSGAPSDFLVIEYAGGDKLYLPIYRLNVIQKYVGSGDFSLDRLGSQQFAKTKEKVRDAVKKLAFDLVQLYAERKIRPGIPFSPRDAEFREFEGQFPFDETRDQMKAIDAVLSDMESGRSMDRVVCGDVGYGKTEVAIRAAFRAVSDGKQVAVLVPTTILAQQHEQTFKNRLKDYPLILESVSRFKSAKEQRLVLEGVAKGKVDIVIGTHRLLSKDVQFSDLGLVIVDEEHRFGVEHKEKLKALRINTHILTLTATPIPRTLHMALAGLRDISLINTPPINRLPIRTFVSRYDESIIKRAIEFELSRGGQVFFLSNRVSGIQETVKQIKQLVPSAIVIAAHGQMPEAELENTMLSFYQKKANVLVCTTIIESGLDLPSANTILIQRADALGLAQLYQIRGRVGRGEQRAYAYLFIPTEGAMTEEAKQRLEVIQKFVELGSGFSIASHDLEIRGGGDLLGPQQSGHIAAVGFDLYTELLEEAIRDLQGKPLPPEESRREPEIKAPFPSFLGDDYVPDVHQRLSLYRRFSAAQNESEVDVLEEELRDRFGSLPVEAQNLLWLIRVKILLKKTGIDGLTVGTEKISLLPGPASQLNPVRAIAKVSAHPHQYQLTPDSRFVARVPTGTLRDLYFALETLLKSLES